MIKFTRPLINIIHIFFVAPLIASIALDKFPQQYKQHLLYLAVLVFIYHAYKLVKYYGFNLEFMNGGHNIKMFDASPGYEYPIYHIKAGETVVWHNVGDIDKTVTAIDNSFNSGYIKSKEMFSLTFTEPGIYDYYSIPQKGWMMGKIIVEPIPEE